MEQHSPSIEAYAAPAPYSAQREDHGFFIVLARDHWQRLWQIPTSNRLNLVCAFLVLAAGTNSSNRITTWSASACERYVGIGVPRARTAIGELIEGGLAELVSGPRSERIRYRLAARGDERMPIFLPMSLVVGKEGEGDSLLKSVRATGDELALRMLIDLHGLVQPDVTFGIGTADLFQGKSLVSRAVISDGVNTVWELARSREIVPCGIWLAPHLAAKDASGKLDKVPLWRRLGQMTAQVLYFEPWVFDGLELDAEPLFPIPGFPGTDWTRELTQLHSLRRRAVRLLADVEEGETGHDIEEKIYVVLPSHHRAPVLRGVAKLWDEADTPGRRRLLEQRRQLILTQTAWYERLLRDVRVCDTED